MHSAIHVGNTLFRRPIPIRIYPYLPFTKGGRRKNCPPSLFAMSSQTADAATTTVVEGSCQMTFESNERNDVFYNPVQVQNRDLSVLMLALYGERRQQAQYEQYRAWEQKQLLRKEAAEPTDDSISTTVNNPPSAPTTDTVLAPGSSLRLALSSAAGVPPAPSALLTTAQRANLRRGEKLPLETVRSEIRGPTDLPKVQLQVLDALAASGLRSMRYWKECPRYISHITINDLDPNASARTLRALERNELSEHLVTSPVRSPGIRVSTQDATHVLYNSRLQRKKGRPHVFSDPAKEPTLSPEELNSLQWDVIDLDPYGSAAPFLDAAVQAVAHGGLLNVTCTDTRVLSGTHQAELCFNRYGAFPMVKSGYWSEMALRMVLYSIAMSAAKYGRSIKPILSVGMDFYLRIFVEVYDNKSESHELSLKVGYVYQSTQCPSFYTEPLAHLGGGENKNLYQPSRVQHSVCAETGGALKIGGPIWLGPLHDPTVLQTALDRLERPVAAAEPDMRFLATRERLFGLLTACLQELPDAPLFYHYANVIKCLHAPPFPLHSVKSALANAGYKVSGYHKEPMAIKTNAPPSVLWDVMRASILQRPLEKPSPPGSVAERILSVPPSFEVSFAPSRAVLETRLYNRTVTRFPNNPEPNWGPKPRAKKRRES